MTEPPEKMAKLEKENIFESLSNLDAFELVEVLGSSVNRKVINLDYSTYYVLVYLSARS